ncbi:MAG: PAS domain-containing protein [Gemmatimonadaceae bacterium]|nr:PAS domain-containing protein [Gemmatimonadaceae bacterium]
MTRGRIAAPLTAAPAPLALGDVLADPLLVVRRAPGVSGVVGAEVTYANAAAAAWAGRPQAALLAEPVEAGLPVLARRIDEAGLVAQVARDGVGAQTLLALDGGAVVDVHAAPLDDAIVLHWRDVSHVRAIEAAHRLAEQRLSLALAAASVGIFVWDLATGRLTWNDHHFAILGHAPGTVEPSYEAWRARVLPEDLPATETAIRRALEHDTDYRMTYRIRRADDGAVRWVEGRARLVHRADGTPLEMHGSLVDVTERRAAEEELRRSNESLEARVRERTAIAEERAEQLRQLALALTATEAQERRRIAQLLHDSVQQMISAAKMRVGMMRLQAVQPDVRTGATEVEQMLDKVLTAARTLAIELHPPVLQEVGLGAALRWLADEFATRHRLSVRLTLPAVEPPLSDQTRIVLFDAARELLFNVVKHAGTADASADVATDAERGVVRLRVVDAGAGCEPADAAARSTFGLAHLEHRIGLLRGSLVVDSALGAGTRVLVSLPLDGTPTDAATPGD